ncbi:MAG: aldehyde dehydrogenase EutE, partial [Planctomycetaceae bacterium]
MQATEQAIRQVVQEVLSQLAGRAVASPAAANRWGVFDSVDDAVAAAQQGFEQLSRASLEQRRTAIDIVKRICEEQAEE